MESYRTEEEQVEALRKWWRDNSKSILAAIVVALAAGYGWQGWQGHRLEQAERASALYLDLLEAVGASPAVAISEESSATARHLAGQLKADYGGSTYAQFAALQLAKLAVASEDLAAAEAELRWVLTRGPNRDIQRVAQLRLARVVVARGKPQAALDMLTGEAGAYQPIYAEVRGDIYRQMDRADDALNAYRQAATYNEANGTANSAALDLKLQSLQLEPARSGGAIAQRGSWR